MISSEVNGANKSFDDQSSVKSDNYITMQYGKKTPQGYFGEPNHSSGERSSNEQF